MESTSGARPGGGASGSIHPSTSTNPQSLQTTTDGDASNPLSQNVVPLSFFPEPSAVFSVARSQTSQPSTPDWSVQPYSEDLSTRLRRSIYGGTVGEGSKDNRAVAEDKHKRQSGIQNGLRGLMRRASITLKAKARPRRNTLTHPDAVAEDAERPATSPSKWQILRSAASFSRHQRPLLEADYSRSIDSCDGLAMPVPGAGSAPPIIPMGRGGETARAAAAQQNEYLEKVERFSLLTPRMRDIADPQGDCESGVGIVMSDDNTFLANQVPISHVDFIKDLPLELSIQILSQLDRVALTRAGLVSTTWQRVTSNGHIWREAYCRDWSQGYAISKALKPGDGHGLPPIKPDMDWQKIHKARKQLKDNWSQGNARHIYLTGHLDSIYCVQFDENKIITGSRDKTIRIWNQHTLQCDLIIGPPATIASSHIMIDENGEHVHRFPGTSSRHKGGYVPATRTFPIHHNASILCLQYDEDILVTGSSDGTAIIHDVRNGYVPIRRLAHHTAAILDLAFDDRYIVTCSKDVTICIWSRKTGALIKELRGHTGPVNAVQMRGNTIVSCSGDFKVKLWNIDTGKCIREFIGHTKGLACSQFSDDARFIASAGNDKVIRIWDAHSGECLQTITAHDNLVRSLHIDSVSGRLISGSYDQDIKVFEMSTGRLLLDFPKWHSSWVLGAKSDYRRIISTGQDPKILIMDFGQGVEGLELLEGRMENGRGVAAMMPFEGVAMKSMGV